MKCWQVRWKVRKVRTIGFVRMTDAIELWCELRRDSKCSNVELFFDTFEGNTL